MSKLRQLWKRLDYNGNGIVSLAEIDKMVEEMVAGGAWPAWLNNKPALMRAYKKTILKDGDGDDWVTKREFHNLLLNLFWYNKLYQIFDVVDGEDRRIDCGEFVRGLSKMGLHLGPQQAAEEFQKIDANGGGQVLFVEFCAYVRSRVHPDGNSSLDADIMSGEHITKVMRSSHGHVATRELRVTRKTQRAFDAVEQRFKGVLANLSTLKPGPWISRGAGGKMQEVVGSPVKVCRALKQWSIEGPPRNPRKAAGDLASLLEESQQKQTQEGCEAVSESAAAAVQCEELRSQLAELEKELAMAADEKAKLLEEQRRAEEAAAMLRADLDTRDAARRAIVPAAAPTAAVSDATLRQRLESLSSHLSSVLAPVSAACRTRPLCSYKESRREAAPARCQWRVKRSRWRRRPRPVPKVQDRPGAGGRPPGGELFVTAAPWVEHAALGGSSCVFAYGATGSGKTHSILGSSNSAGLAQHALRRLLETGEVRVSMLEVYCEQIRDLLATEGPRAPLQCSRRDGQGRMVLDCVEVLAGEVVEAERLLQRGFAHRATEGTLCNDSSSRSHVVLTVQAVSGTGRLVLVDLAGSENVQRSGADEDAKLLAEAKAINRSLSALADVVEATAKQQPLWRNGFGRDALRGCGG
ncbi:unnamed protein product, partial [Effrenium voratum]